MDTEKVKKWHKDNYGAAHIISVIALVDTESIFALMEESAQEQVKLFAIPDVSNNEATDFTCGIPTPDSDKECCMVCGNLIYSEVAVSCSTCKWNMAKWEYKCEECNQKHKNYEQDTDY